MGIEAWKNLWTFTFFAASFLFYLTVVVVAVRGMGDVKRMIAAMIAERTVQLSAKAALKGKKS